MSNSKSNYIEMSKILSFFLLAGIFSVALQAQQSSFLVLGDLHYDLMEDHDMDWLRTKPDDPQKFNHEIHSNSRNGTFDCFQYL